MIEVKKWKDKMDKRVLLSANKYRSSSLFGIFLSSAPPYLVDAPGNRVHES